MCSCIARTLKVYNLSLTNFVNIQRNYLKSIDVKLAQIACPLGNQVCFPHYNNYENRHGGNCLRTINAKRLSSSLLCEERASENESYQIEIKKTNCYFWPLSWEMISKM